MSFQVNAKLYMVLFWLLFTSWNEMKELKKKTKENKTKSIRKTWHTKLCSLHRWKVLFFLVHGNKIYSLSTLKILIQKILVFFIQLSSILATSRSIFSNASLCFVLCFMVYNNSHTLWILRASALCWSNVSDDSFSLKPFSVHSCSVSQVTYFIP